MNRTPFAAFEIHLTDGAHIKVEEPWQIATFPEGSTCTIYEDGDRMRIIAVRNITEVLTVAG
jgi:hypothetical protein